MNKKLSLMLAAFVAAGWSLTAEAGVVKIANPTSGNSYVIAEQGWSPSNATKTLLQSDDYDVKGVNASAYGTITEASDLWKYLGDANGFTLSQKNGFIGAANNAGAAPALVNSAVSFTWDATGLKAETGGYLTFSNGSKASWSTGTAVEFFAYTKRVAKAQNGVVLKVGEKYLVLDDNVSPAVLKLVNEETYQSYIKLGKDDNTLWKLNADGTYESYINLSNGYKYLQITSSGLVLNTSGDVFESNEAEGIFGIWDATAASFTFIKENAAGDGLVTTNEQKESVSIVAATPEIKTPDALAVITDNRGNRYTLANTVSSSEYYFITSNTAGSVNNAYVLYQEDSASGPKMTQFSNLSTTELNGAYWKISEVKQNDGTYKYSFVNKKGVTLTVDPGVSVFNAASKYLGGVVLTNAATSSQYLNLVTSGRTVSFGANTTINNVTLGFYQVGTEEFAVKDLCKYYNTYFDLNLMDKKGGTSDLEGDLFDGGLIPMEIVYHKYSNGGGYYALEEANANATTFLLKRKADGAYIVLDWDKTWSVSGIDQHVTKGGFKFDKLSEDNLLAYVQGTAVPELKARHLGFAFAVEYAGYEETDNNKSLKYIKVVDYSKACAQSNDADVPAVNADDRKATDAVKYPVYLTTYETSGKTYLTVNAEKDKVILYAELQEKTLVHGSDKDNNPLNWKYVSIKFVNHPSIKYTTEDSRDATLNGRVLGMARDNGNQKWNAHPAEAEKFLANKPEGQWVVSMTNAGALTAENKNGVALDETKDVAFTFTNRENPDAEYSVARMFHLDGNKFAVEYNNNRGAFACKWNPGDMTRDTLEITPLNIESQGARLMDGYKNYTDAEIQDTEYRLIMNSTSDVDYYVSENHAGKHLLGISTKESDAVNWRLVRFDRKAIKDVDGYVKYATDSIYTIHHPQYYSNGKYYAYNDTLAIVTYALQNTANGEYLTYEDLQSQDILSMMCDPDSKNKVNHYYDEVKDKENGNYLTSAYRFVIKEKMDGLFNILGVSGRENEPTGIGFGYNLNLSNKLYGASTKNTVEVETAYTQINSNDLFRLEAVDAPVYRKVAQGDTIRMFREENPSEVLFEDGQFLNVGNIAQLKDMAPAMYVDTAYINRGENTRYQYLLVVNPVRKDEIRDNAGHVIHRDTTYGRFLINQIDSAVWANENGNIHQNKFINDVEAAEPYVKLGFHWGYRTKDQLFLTDKSYKEVEEVINLNSRDFNKAKFAFRYTTPSANDPESAFKIQTRYIDYNAAIDGRTEENNNGFLRTVNGVMVVVNGLDRGEEFNLAAESSDPTANETISTGSVVVAGVDGAVVVKGAEGKNVIVSTILGKVVANEVVSSDNATIAAPAGIVVVSVDGESFKVVVK